MSELGLLSQELNEAMTAANARLDSRFCDAMSNKDVEDAMKCFLDSPDLAVVLQGKVLRGPAAVRQFLTERLSGVKTGHLQINKVTHWRPGETDFAVGTANYDMETRDGTRPKLQECWMDARQKGRGPMGLRPQPHDRDSVS